MDIEFNILDDVVIAGFKGNIQDTNKTLNTVNSIQNSCCDGGIIQLMDANAIAGVKHVKHGIIHGFNSFKNGSNIANDVGIEIFLRITATRQISKALDIIGLKKGEMNICSVLINCPDYFLDKLSNIFKRDDSVLKEDKEILKNIYNISENELSIYPITDILIDRTTELILEI
ncbi:MAG: KEOPS complex subunit Cgi121 [Methanobrevibacter sp.]|jgi:KEOPS complex subunit Cgi121|nr:KEOPS complex subunit Cgi121 [Candidatus Methanovirga basalitermitum]